MPKFIQQLNCGICGIITGEIELSSEFGWIDDDNFEKMGIADVRCSSCELTHGKFKKMVEEYRQKIKNDGIEAEMFVKNNKKQSDFNTALNIEIENLKNNEKNVII